MEIIKNKTTYDYPYIQTLFYETSALQNPLTLGKSSIDTPDINIL
jgi:hypothetical protein